MTATPLRRQLRDRRRALTAEELDHHSRLATRRVLATRWFLAARRIALYLAVDGELDPWPLAQRAWAMGKQVYLPVLLPYGSNRLWFAPFQPDSRLRRNRYGIPEPVDGPRQRVSPHALDLVFTPLVAFDRAGNRLGMGGGYYDRTFGFLRWHRCWQRPRLIGLAHDFQCQRALPRQDWDVPLAAAATERHLYLFPDPTTGTCP